MGDLTLTEHDLVPPVTYDDGCVAAAWYCRMCRNLFMAGRNISVTHVGLLLVHDYAVIIAWTFLQIVCSQPGTLSTSHSLPRMNGWFVAFIAASSSRDMVCTCSTVITSSE